MLIFRWLLLSVFFASFYVKAETICVGHYIGNNVGFSSYQVGDAFNKLELISEGRWNGGSQNAYYKSLRNFSGWSSYSVAVPKELSLPNSPVRLVLTLPGSTITVPTNDNWQAVFVQQTHIGCAHDTHGGWQEIADTGITAGAVNLRISGVGLSSGQYALDVPYILAWGSSEDGDSGRDFQNTWKTGNVGTGNVTGYFHIEFKVNNKCDVISPNNELVLKHGEMTPDMVSGNKVASKELSLSCLVPSSVKFQFQPQRVELGNGISSKLTLKISDKEHSENPVSSVIKNSKLKVVSTLAGKVGAAGELYGSSVLTILYN